MSGFSCGLKVLNLSNCAIFNRNWTVTSVGHSSIDLQKLVELYLIGLVCLVGIFGNVVTIVVLRRDKERREALLLLQALAVADGLYLIVALLRYPLKYILPVYRGYTAMQPRDYTAMQPVVFPMLKTCQTITIWTMVLVTIDRYIYVCKPFYALQMFKRGTRRWAITAVFVLGVIYNLPRYCESCIVELFNPCTNITLTASVTRPQFNHPLYYDIYQQGAYIVLLYIVPLVILAFMNTRLIQAIYYSKRRHRDYPTTPEYSENNATLVLVIIVVVFIICETPELLQRLATVLERKIDAKIFTNTFSKGLVRFNIISQLLMVINSSINFFIYLIFGRRFRGVMKETFTVKFPTSVTHVTHEAIPLQRAQHNLLRANLLLKQHVDQVNDVHLAHNQ